MVWPESWNKFLESDTFSKIANIMDSDGWRFNPILQSGVIVVEPKKTDTSKTSK